MTPKQEGIWAYIVKNPTAPLSKVARATRSSPSYVHSLKSKIGTPNEVFEKEAKAAKVTRASILDTAKAYVTKDRAADHGDMEDNFAVIGKYWSVHLGVTVTAVDVAVMMTLLKAARIKSNPAHQDNWVDGAGYMACGGEIAAK